MAAIADWGGGALTSSISTTLHRGLVDKAVQKDAFLLLLVHAEGRSSLIPCLAPMCDTSCRSVVVVSDQPSTPTPSGFEEP
jgi:hypothetical protein